MEKVAIVTGGAKGIGYGSSLRLLEDGAHVIAFDRDTAALAQAEKDFAQFGEKFSAVNVDISSDSAVSAAINSVGKKYGQINVS